MTLDVASSQTAETPATEDQLARPGFAGIDHVALTVTDLDASQRFYTEVLDFVPVMDVGYGRICMHPSTGFVLALVRHDDTPPEPFSELNVGADHLGLAAASREVLKMWEARFDSYGVHYTPIRDELFGSHLNFRDPDNIALELSSSNDLMVAAQSALATGQKSAADIAAFIAENVSPDFVAADPGEAD